MKWRKLKDYMECLHQVCFVLIDAEEVELALFNMVTGKELET